MLLVIKIEKLDTQAFIDMDGNKDVTITGKGMNIYFKDNYIEELEEKAKKFDELIETGEKKEHKENGRPVGIGVQNNLKIESYFI